MPDEVFWVDPDAVKTDEDPNAPGFLGDAARSVGAGAADIGAQASSLGRAAADASQSPQMSRAFASFEKMFAGMGDYAREGMSNGDSAGIAAAITDPVFWQHPLRNGALKTIGMTPAIAATIVGAALGGELPTIGAMVAGGSLSAGQATEDVYKQIDGMKDEDLQTKIPGYKTMRDMGIDEATARSELSTTLMGAKPLINGLIGAAATAIGPAGTLARRVVGAGGVAGAAERGLAGRIGLGAAEGAGGMAAMSGGQNIASQDTSIQLGNQQEFDNDALVTSVLDGSFWGGVVGGVVGGVAGKRPGGQVTDEGKNPPPEAPPEPPPGDQQGGAPPGTVRDPASVDAPVVGTSGGVDAPVVGTSGGGDAPSGNVEQVSAGGPTLEQSVALNATAGTGEQSGVGEVGGGSPQTGLDNDLHPNVDGDHNGAAGEPPVVGVAPPEAPHVDDAGKTAIEPPATFEAQQKQLIAGERPAMLFPKGTPKEQRLARPKGMKTIVTKDGEFHYNPEKITPKELKAASKAGTLNEALGLGPVSKDEAVARVAQGEPEVAVTERQPDGTEVKAAGGTEVTAPDQAAALEASKTPGNTVQVEDPAQVIAARDQARSAAAKEEADANATASTAGLNKELTDVPPTPAEAELGGEAKPNAELGLVDTTKPKAAQKPVTQTGKNRTKAEITHENKINDLFLSTATDQTKVPRSSVVKARLEQIIAQAKELGIKIPTRVSDAATSRGRMFLAEVRKLHNEFQSGTPGMKRMMEFAAREFTLRHGDDKAIVELKAQRRAEGDLANKKGEGVTGETGDESGTQAPNRGPSFGEGDETAREQGYGEDSEQRPGTYRDEAAAEEQHVSEAEAAHTDEMASRQKPEEIPLEDDAEPTGPTGDEQIAAREKAEFEQKLERVGEDAVRAPVTSAGKGKIAVEVRKKGQRIKRSLLSKSEGQEIDPVEAKAVETALRGKTVHEAAAWIAENAPSHAYREIARRVKAMLDRLAEAGVKFDMKIVNDRDMAPRSIARGTARGLAERDANGKTTVWLAGHDTAKPGTTYRTALHELIHAATMTAIRLGTLRSRATGEYFAKDTALRTAAGDLIKLGNAIMDHFNSRIHEFERGKTELSDIEQTYMEGRNNAFQNADEILAWGLTDAKMNAYLESIPYKGGTLWSKFVENVRKFLGLSARSDTALSELLRITEGLTDPGVVDTMVKVSKEVKEPHFEQSLADVSHSDHVAQQLADVSEDVTNFAKDLLSGAKDKSTPGSGARKFAFKFLTNDQLRQTYEKIFGKDHLRNFVELLERQDVRTNDIKSVGDKLTRRMVGARAEHNIDFPKMEELLQDSRIYGVDPSEDLSHANNKHLKGSSGMQGVEKHPEMKAAFDKLHPDLQKLFKDTLKFYEQAHSAHARALVDVVFDGGKFDPTIDVEKLKDRYHDDTLTTQDEEIIKSAFPKDKSKALLKAAELKKTVGPYVPLQRRGDFVVMAEHDIATPAGARRIKGSNDDPNGRTFEFTDEKQAKAFVGGLDAHAAVKKVYFDPNTGTRMKVSEAKKLPGGTADERWQVRVQTKHVEFHETEAGARRAREALEADGNYKNVERERRRTDVSNFNHEMSSPQVQALVKSIEANGKMSAEAKKAAVGALQEASMGMQRGNRAMKHQMRANKVSGASTDIVRGTDEYASSNARARARFEYETQVEQALHDLRKWDRGQNDDKTLTRSDVIHELENRLYQTYSPDPKNGFTRVMNRVMTYSFIKRMASPAHLLIHMTHPWMISLPVLGAKHGFAKTSLQLVRAYRDMGAARGIGTGIKGAVKLAKDVSADPVNFIDYFKKNMAGVSDAKALGRMLEELAAKNVIHPESGMEVHRMEPGRNAVDRVIDRVDGSFRQLTQATEAINRVAEAIAAYRMEYQKTSDHAAAVRYAGDTLANSQGLYSRSNAAPIFRNPAIKPFLQFKQFPQMIYHLLGRQIYDVFRDSTPAEKAQAVKTFLGILGTHAAMAGALGLPMEVIKAGVLLANALGVTDDTWSDYEAEASKAAAKHFGKHGGAIVMHGLTHALGPLSVDVHHRLGLNSLFFFGEPKAGDINDEKRWLFDLLGGAPASLAVDFKDGMSQIIKGNFVKGAEKLVPAKAFDDIIRAVDIYAHGKPTSRGAPGMKPYGLGPAAVRALGFTPASESTYNEARSAAYSDIAHQKKDQRGLLDGWVNADAEGKAAARQEIVKYNRGVGRDEQITPAMMTRAVKSRKDAEHGGTVLGFKPTKRTKAILDRVKNTYDTNDGAD